MMSLVKRRRGRLLSMADGFANVVAARPQNVFYLTGFWGGGVAIAKPDRTVLITSKMEEERARAAGREVEVVAADRSEMHARMRRELERGRTLIDTYDERLPRTSVDEAPYLCARRRKDVEELERIADASRRIEKVYEAVERSMRAGMTERKVAAEAMRVSTEEALSPLGAEGSLDPIIVAGGPNGSYPHAGITDRKIRDGDMVVVDLFYRYEGYCSDCTRTYAVGRVPSERREGYEAVLEAQLEGVSMVRKGTPCRDVHKAVLSCLRGRGLEKYFTHSTGHGVGIDIHELPGLASSSESVLEEGDVVTVEPGIYVPGEFGVRIEDTLAVGRAARNLSRYTKELLVLG